MWPATMPDPDPTDDRGPDPTAAPADAGTVLVVDDEPAIVESLTKIFKREGLHVLGATDGTTGLELLRKHRVGVMLTDLMMPRTGGMDLLRAAKTVAPETEVVLMTAYGTVETAVEAMKEGAYDFVTKPVKRAHVVRIVKNALEKQSLVVENRALRAQLAERRRRAIVGTSLAWRRTMDVVMQAAPSEATVLLLGESGTGKELLARALHENSTRAKGPFVAINCAAIPESILEAELFGYEKGAFTGAATSRDGRFEAADGGTLFLDEIGEISRHVQVKLLRVLQEGEIERLGGGGKPRRIDIRLLAATNVNLAEEVKAGRFREDLYYRLNVIPVHVPPLRDRRDDVPLLVQHFISVYADKNAKQITGCTPAAIARLVDYPWPGNVRELENAIERAVVLTRSPMIDEDALPREIRDAEGHAVSGHALSFPIGTPLAEIEMRVIRETLRHTRGDKRLAAKLLGIATRTIYRRLEDEAGEPGDSGPDDGGED
jgi:DNA-binding NtrC family response regulator